MMCLMVVLALPVQANDLDISLKSPVPQKEQPQLVLKTRKAADEIRLDLKSHGKRVRKKLNSVGKGQSLEIPLPQNAVGVWQWKGSLKVSFADGSQGSMPLSFTTEVRRPPFLKLHSNGLDLKKKEVTVVLSRAAQKVSLQVVDESGQIVAEHEQNFSSTPAGQPLKLKWDSVSVTPVMKVALVGHDSEGFFSPTLSLYPWSLAIPHDEVMFETASHEILSSETSKLTEALSAMKKKISQYETLIPIKLFVLGHTDSIGEKERNQQLSQRRAASIARWFVAQGVAVPVFARGFGETDLRIPTGDEVDEAANRRADYILSVEPPVKKNWQSWKTIQGRKPASDPE